MLHELVVRNLGVIAEASVVFGPGLTALTGETGAGKTLVTEAIGLLTGGRADPSLVRSGSDEAVVEGRFVTSDGEETVVRRIVPASGRSRAYLDGNLATLSAIAEAIEGRVEVHGQHGHHVLLRPAARRLALDEYGEHDTATLAGIRGDLRAARAELEALGGDDVARARELELLRYQTDEIDAANVDGPTEDNDLAALESLLGDASGHAEAAGKAIELLSTDGPLGSALADAIAALGDRVPFEAASERLVGVQSDLADIADSVRSASENIEDDPQRLHEIQQRREVLTGLRRKYGPDLAAVLAYRVSLEQQVNDLMSHAERAESLGNRIDDLEQAESVAAATLGGLRRGSAPSLAKAVLKDMRKLALPKAALDVSVGPDPGDDVDFLVSMNPGAPLLPVAKAASGGELSRIMLALQLVVGSTADTIIYDEVDAGVGGEAATSIGRALAGVGRGHQVLVVTHLPQVAAFADHQINIAKQVKGSQTITELHPLDRASRVVELARMLSGTPDSDNARAHAAELLESAAQ